MHCVPAFATLDLGHKHFVNCTATWRKTPVANNYASGERTYKQNLAMSSLPSCPFPRALVRIIITHHPCLRVQAAVQIFTLGQES